MIDEGGIGAVSMRAVAGRVGVEAQSLYAHVDNRGSLLDAVVDRIVNELSDDPEVSFHPTKGWRPYLANLARGVRRYARAHPHAFPLVSTRPQEAPWINPPLRSLRWIEAFLAALRSEGFTEQQTLFAYRSFNSFLLGFLLLETGAMSLEDPAQGDGSFVAGSGGGEGRPESAVPGGLSPTRTAKQRRAVRAADSAADLLDPLQGLDLDRYPTVHLLAAGLAEDYYEVEFESGLVAMLDRIEARLAERRRGRARGTRR